MGRVRYQEWSAYWPEHADEPFGGVLNATKKYIVSKYVVSNTLANAEWQNSEILGGDVAAKVGALKAEDGGDIVMFGQRHHGSLAPARGAARRIAPLRAPDRRRHQHGAALSVRRPADGAQSDQLGVSTLAWST
jgi:hypothetical protein